MNTEVLQASGNLEIIKIFNNGSEEVVFSDHNLITSGLGVSIATIFVGSGSVNIKDHQIRWFQMGSGDYAVAYDNTVYKLELPLAAGGYTGKIVVDTHQLANPDGSNYGSLPFAWIPQTAVRRTSTTSVTYLLSLDNSTCNGVSLSEIGLFVHNPLYKFIGSSTVRSMLAAYRKFSAIAKTNEFSLLFRWTLSF